MVKAGLSNVKLLPDPAFQLERVDLELPDGFIEGNTVGINLSPMVMNCENGDNITLKNYEKLIEHIIATSDMQIALIPHVVWAENDDRVPLKMLYEKYKNTGRVVMIEDHNCMELKGYIARCRFMIAARTHASIAAYSTCVPTLVVGYSVKAKGIAKDIFGTYENYVLPVQSLSQEEDLTNAFDWIYQREDQIRTHLQSMMPEYRDRALLIGEELKKIM
jgi:polysaccharide pyruvyl transferase WcaK-like protein